MGPKWNSFLQPLPFPVSPELSPWWIVFLGPSSAVICSQVWNEKSLCLCFPFIELTRFPNKMDYYFFPSVVDLRIVLLHIICLFVPYTLVLV